VNLRLAGCEDDDMRAGRRLTTAAIVVASVTATSATMTGCGSGRPTHAAAMRRTSESAGHAAVPHAAVLHGAVPVGQRQTRPEFELVDTGGTPFDFGARTRGRVTLLYFGYTHCPDQCPTSMADVASALRQVPAAVSAQVIVVFASTDPWRDTRPVLRRWLDRFHPPQPYVGLTGTPTQVAGAETSVGLPVSQREAAPSGYGSGRYAVDHFAAVMAYGRDDRLATLYPAGVSPADIATDLQVLVKG
jgi:protein SCO1/2